MYGSFVDDWKTPDEYISRKAVEEMIEDAQIISDGENCGYCTEDIEISSIPAVNVIPVKRAHWIISETDYGFCESIGKNYKERKYKCSACGYETGTQAEKFICCPICTAMMDGGTP